MVMLLGNLSHSDPDKLELGMHKEVLLCNLWHLGPGKSELGNDMAKHRHSL